MFLNKWFFFISDTIILEFWSIDFFPRFWCQNLIAQSYPGKILVLTPTHFLATIWTDLINYIFDKIGHISIVVNENGIFLKLTLCWQASQPTNFLVAHQLEIICNIFFQAWPSFGSMLFFSYLFSAWIIFCKTANFHIYIPNFLTHSTLYVILFFSQDKCALSLVCHQVCALIHLRVKYDCWYIVM